MANIHYGNPSELHHVVGSDIETLSGSNVQEFIACLKPTSTYSLRGTWQNVERPSNCRQPARNLKGEQYQPNESLQVCHYMGTTKCDNTKFVTASSVVDLSDMHLPLLYVHL